MLLHNSCYNVPLGFIAINNYNHNNKNKQFSFFYFRKDSAFQAIFFVIYLCYISIYILKIFYFVLLHPHIFLFQIYIQILSVSILIFHSCKLILVNKEKE